jgi:hypothetical protein
MLRFSRVARHLAPGGLRITQIATQSSKRATADCSLNATTQKSFFRTLDKHVLRCEEDCHYLVSLLFRYKGLGPKRNIQRMTRQVLADSGASFRF